jgi:predicted house-cleaning noncanonical NTP pyrophosphatase (MazG superfamily)
MKKLQFNRLIRDKVRDKLVDKGPIFRIKKLDEVAFERELFKKVGEEGEGLIAAKTREEFISEFDDLLYVVEEIKRFKNVTDRELEEIREENFKKKGGFNERLYLYWTSDDGYQTNERKDNKPKK